MNSKDVMGDMVKQIKEIQLKVEGLETMHDLQIRLLLGQIGKNEASKEARKILRKCGVSPYKHNPNPNDFNN